MTKRRYLLKGGVPVHVVDGRWSVVILGHSRNGSLEIVDGKCGTIAIFSSFTVAKFPGHLKFENRSLFEAKFDREKTNFKRRQQCPV